MAVALSRRPKNVMMDEPTAGMSPSDRIGAVDLIARLREEHQMTTMLTEHDMDVVFGLSDRIMVLNYGEVIAIGTGPEIRESKATRDVYLGHEGSHA